MRKPVVDYSSTDSVLVQLHNELPLWPAPFGLAFVAPWQSVLNDQDILPVFDALENNLNKVSPKRGALNITIPFVCIDGVREP